MGKTCDATERIGVLLTEFALEIPPRSRFSRSAANDDELSNLEAFDLIRSKLARKMRGDFAHFRPEQTTDRTITRVGRTLIVPKSEALQIIALIYSRFLQKNFSGSRSVKYCTSYVCTFHKENISFSVTRFLLLSVYSYRESEINDTARIYN